MTTHSVVEDFDVFLDRSSRLEACAKPAVVNEFLFHRAPETLYGGIVVAVASAGHILLTARIYSTDAELVKDLSE